QSSSSTGSASMGRLSTQAPHSGSSTSLSIRSDAVRVEGERTSGLSEPYSAVAVVDAFHPAVRTWFGKRFPDGPTPPQAGGWAEIAGGRDTLIAAPTGSGKTLAAFLLCIDRLYRANESGAAPAGGPQVVYLSPLKALAVDI